MDRYSASISLLISKGGSLTRQLTNALNFSATTTGYHDSAGGDGGKRFRALQDKDGHYSSRLGSTRLLSDVSLSLSASKCPKISRTLNHHDRSRICRLAAAAGCLATSVHQFQVTCQRGEKSKAKRTSAILLLAIFRLFSIAEAAQEAAIRKRENRHGKHISLV